MIEFLVVDVDKLLTELVSTLAIGSLYLTVELWWSRFDVNMTDALVFDVPIELVLTFMAEIGTNHLYTKRECLDDEIGYFYGIVLGVGNRDLQCLDPYGIIDVGAFLTSQPCAFLSVAAQHFASKCM